MAVNEQVRALEVATRKCYKVITIATNATVAEYSKVILLDGTTLRYNVSTGGAASLTAPVAGAGEALVSCGGDSEPLQLCEFTPAGAYVNSFLRVYTFDDAGNAVTKDVALDGITAYVITGGNTVKSCGEASTTLTTVAFVATNAAPVTIPANVKSFSVLNLGVDALGISYTDVVMTGGLVDTILGTSPELGFQYSVSEDQDALSGSVDVTPAGLGQAKVRRTI